MIEVKTRKLTELTKQTEKAQDSGEFDIERKNERKEKGSKGSEIKRHGMQRGQDGKAKNEGEMIK